VTTLSIRLFGKLSLQQGSAELEGLRFGRLAELFCYLLLRRDRVHSREVLASQMWGDSTTRQSKKYLRHALWQLQTILKHGGEQGPLLVVDRDSVRLKMGSAVWLDVASFENACAQFQDVPHAQLDEPQAQMLKAAVELYRGDLLEGWYQEWCLFERERLQNLYLLIVEKLMRYCEQRQQYQAGMEMGERILRLDRAHERTYQTLMRMQYLAGDRAGALRQYQRCESALRKELEVRPARNTLELLEEIRADSLQEPGAVDLREERGHSYERGADSVRGILACLRRVLSLLSETQMRLEREVQAISDEVPRKPPGQITIPSKRRANQR
jgi:DNA-binding SARP family transcriptional activator